jgi:hypothetical protein
MLGVLKTEAGFIQVFVKGFVMFSCLASFNRARAKI